MAHSFNKRDFILITSVIAAGIVITLAFLFLQKPGNIVTVSVNGNITAQFPLNEDRIYEIAGENGGKNILHIENGEAWIEEASCPDKLCVNMGRISKNGQTVICLPNRVVIEIRSNKDNGVDAVLS